MFLTKSQYQKRLSWEYLTSTKPLVSLIPNLCVQFNRMHDNTYRFNDYNFPKLNLSDWMLNKWTISVEGEPDKSVSTYDLNLIYTNKRTWEVNKNSSMPNDIIFSLFSDDDDRTFNEICYTIDKTNVSQSFTCRGKADYCAPCWIFTLNQFSDLGYKYGKNGRKLKRKHYYDFEDIDSIKFKRGN